MTTEKIQTLTRDLENLPPEQLGAVAEIIKKRGITFKQNNDELELDINNVDTETLWELESFVTNYKKSSTSKRKPEVALQARARATRNAPIISSSPMVAGALKESRTGEMHTSASSSHVEGADNASSCSSDSGSSSSDSDSDSSSDAGPARM